MIKVLHVLSSLDGGGVETMLYNYYTHIDREKIHFDFIVHDKKNGMIENKMVELGSQVYHVTNKHESVLKNYKEIKKIIYKNDYDVIHCHQNEMSFLPLFIAKNKKIKLRIMHSHNYIEYKTGYKKIIKNILAFIGKIFANKYLACTIQAGNWLFGEKFFSKKGIVLKNAIDLKKFEFDIDTRNKIRNELDVKDKFVIGNIGRMAYQKNHEKLIDIFNEYLKINENSVLILVGDGELHSKIEEKAKKYGILDKIIFLGIIDNVNEIINAFDIFLFPTRFEGLGIVVVEAQANGLPVYMSDVVPSEAIIENQLIKKINLNESSEIWANLIDTYDLKRLNVLEKIQQSGYNIEQGKYKLEKIYIGENYES